jgi:hypothetical protein
VCNQGCVDREDHRQHATIEHRHEGGRQKVKKDEVPGVREFLEEIKNVCDRNYDQKRHYNGRNSLPRLH